VVVNAASSHLMKTLLPDALSKSPVGTRSMSGWTAIVRARRRKRVAHTVAMHMPYIEEFQDIFDKGLPPKKPTVYVCAQEVCHGRSGWEDDEPLFVMANAPSTDNDHDYSNLKTTVLNTMKKRGLCGDKAAVVWERTPWDLSRQFPDTGGNIYGMASHGWTAAFQRPSNRVGGVQGLYLASGSAHPGGGVPLAMQSGILAADLLCDDQGISTQGES
jgi:1-hydroxycarotenoid 3,4-desaturase